MDQQKKFEFLRQTFVTLAIGDYAEDDPVALTPHQVRAVLDHFHDHNLTLSHSDPESLLSSGFTIRTLANSLPGHETKGGGDK